MKASKEEKPLEFQLEKVTTSLGMTLNIGDYESIRVDTFIGLRSIKECKTAKEFAEHKDRILEEASRIAKEDVIDKVKAIRKQYKK